MKIEIEADTVEEAVQKVRDAFIATQCPLQPGDIVVYEGTAYHNSWAGFVKEVKPAIGDSWMLEGQFVNRRGGVQDRLTYFLEYGNCWTVVNRA